MLISKGFHVTVVDDLSANTDLRYLKNHIESNSARFCKIDVRDFDKLLELESDFEFIFHLAAQSYVLVSFNEPAATLQTNIIGTLNILEAVKQCNINPTIHICSSSEVYGQVKKDEVPIKETNVFRPASPYAVSKVGEDMISLQYYLSYGIKTIRSRMFTHTGPRRGEVFVVSAFAKQIAKIELGLQEPLLKVGNLDSVRTFLDVRDAVNAYYLLVQH